MDNIVNMVKAIFCLNCEKKIDRTDAHIDRIGQFTELNLKAKKLGREDVEICFECFEKLTDKSGVLDKSGLFGIT